MQKILDSFTLYLNNYNIDFQNYSYLRVKQGYPNLSNLKLEFYNTNEDLFLIINKEMIESIE